MTRRFRPGSAGRFRSLGTPAVDSTGRRLRLVLQLALLVAALVAIIVYGGAIAERAAGCASPSLGPSRDAGSARP